MSRPSNSELLVQASKARQRLEEKAEAYLGHLRERRSSFESWRGIVPGRLKWEEAYQLQRLLLARPKTGTTKVEIRCNTCGEALTLAVRSRRLFVYYCLAVFAVIAVTACLAFACCRTLEAAAWGAFWALYLSTALEILGESDHHSPLKIVKGSGNGHKLFSPQEISQN